MVRKVRDEITYPFSNCKGATVGVGEWMSNFIPHCVIDIITYAYWFGYSDIPGDNPWSCAIPWCLLGLDIHRIQWLWEAHLWRGVLWRRHQMEAFAALLAICAGHPLVTGEFPGQRPMRRSFDVFIDLRLNKRLSKQSWGWWFGTPSRPLWRHYNVYEISFIKSTFWSHSYF